MARSAGKVGTWLSEGKGKPVPLGPFTNQLARIVAPFVAGRSVPPEASGFSPFLAACRASKQRLRNRTAAARSSFRVIRGAQLGLAINGDAAQGERRLALISRRPASFEERSWPWPINYATRVRYFGNRRRSAGSGDNGAGNATRRRNIHELRASTRSPRTSARFPIRESWSS